MTLVTLGAGAPPQIKLLPVSPLRDVKRLSGRFDDLLAAGTAQPDADYVEILLEKQRLVALLRLAAADVAQKAGEHRGAVAALRGGRGRRGAGL